VPIMIELRAKNATAGSYLRLSGASSLTRQKHVQTALSTVTSPFFVLLVVHIGQSDCNSSLAPNIYEELQIFLGD
jgi:hypothetical protein